MKRKLAVLLCACMLFSGCGNGSSKPLQTETPTAESLLTQAQLPLLEQGIVLEESSNLRYIPNAAVESMIAPKMRLLGNGLLLSEYIGNELVLKHISLEDGALVKEGAAPAHSGTKLFIGSGEIGLCDRASGLISILNEDFHLLVQMLPQTQGIVSLPGYGYHVFYRIGSNTRKKDKNDFSRVYGDNVDNADMVYKNFQKKTLEKSYFTM